MKNSPTTKHPPTPTPTLTPTLTLTLTLILTLTLTFTPLFFTSSPSFTSPLSSSASQQVSPRSSLVPLQNVILLQYPDGVAEWFGSTCSFDPLTVYSPATSVFYAMNGTHLLVDNFPFPQENATFTPSLFSTYFYGSLTTCVVEESPSRVAVLTSNASHLSLLQYFLLNRSITTILSTSKSHPSDGAVYLPDFSALLVARANESLQFASLDLYNTSSRELVCSIPAENLTTTPITFTIPESNTTVNFTFAGTWMQILQAVISDKNEAFILLDARGYFLNASVNAITFKHPVTVILPFTCFSPSSLFFAPILFLPFTGTLPLNASGSLPFLVWNGTWLHPSLGFVIGFSPYFTLEIKIADEVLWDAKTRTLQLINPNPTVSTLYFSTNTSLTVTFITPRLNFTFTIPTPSVFLPPPPRVLVSPVNHYLYGVVISSENDAEYSIRSFTGSTVTTGILRKGTNIVYLPDGWYILEVEGVEKGFIVTGMLSDTLRSNLPAFAQWSISRNIYLLVSLSILILAVSFLLKSIRILLAIPLLVIITPIATWLSLQPILSIL